MCHSLTKEMIWFEFFQHFYKDYIEMNKRRFYIKVTLEIKNFDFVNFTLELPFYIFK